ncbi:putative HTH-type transcriptional regulator YbhD [Vibrio sagamiensis NBRC 104589]|uniref:Putative HTH-type transcriptional regulator YbhD n=2 Tax=Vibrio sagamiensis TaxID=512650 RepID=A0A511QD39_9VIBR|nr:putative HTH-type transcriptional regulator YbhD [Vibrio sagamiensis NBRC 104589]
MMDNIKLQQLIHFVTVVQEGGFRSAAHKVNRSQAALSTSIKTLEENLGKPLFEHGNKSKLTPFGEQCLPKVIQFISGYHSLCSDLRSMASGQQGRVRIATIPSVAAKLIPNVLKKFCTQYPDVEVSLLDDNAAGVEARLLSGDVDLALGNASYLNASSIEFTPLISDPVGVVCLKDNPLAKYTKGVRWQSLQQQPFIRNGTCLLLDSTPARILSEQALYSVANITSLFSVLELGIGITTLPKLAFPNQSSHLIWLPLIEPLLEREIGIFRLNNITVSPQAKAFHDLCVHHLRHSEST